MSSSSPKVPPSLDLAPFRVKQGEHILITGRTGSGKSAFARALLARRRFLIFFRSKDDDITWTMDRKTRTLRTSLSAMDDGRVERLGVAPPPGDARSAQAAEMAETFYQVMQRAEHKHKGGWTLYVDEGKAFDELGLMDELEPLATQGRSKRISLVFGTQRPTWISRYLISEPSHHISFWHDGLDRKRLRECVAQCHYDAISRVGPHQFAWTSGMPPRTWVGSLQDLQEPRLKVLAS